MATYKREQHPNELYRLNSFRLCGLESVELGYRLVSVSGLIDDEDDYEKKINQLSVLISGSIKMPSAPIRVDGDTKIAVIGPLDKLANMTIENRFSLTPDDAFTSLSDEVHRLSLKTTADRIHAKLIRRALDWALDNALKAPSAGWWKFDRRFVSREPLAQFVAFDVQVFPAFFFGFVQGKGGSFELSLTPSVCYAERKSLYEKHGRDIPQRIKGRRFLYKNGLDYYPITVVGIGKPAGSDMMEDPSSGEIVSIQDHLQSKWKSRHLPEIEALDANAPTVAYKTRGQKSRRAHSQLIFELVGVGGGDTGHHTSHNEAIMAAAKRGDRTEELICILADQLKLFGIALDPDRRMRKLNGEVQLFDPPRLQFADGTELATNWSSFERDRWDALTHVGPLDQTDFEDEQLFIFGADLPEEVRNDFKHRLVGEITEIYGKAPRFRNIKAENARSRVVREHFNAITEAVEKRRGFGLLILPGEDRNGETKKLHDALKRALWGRVHTQCVAADKLRSFYQSTKDRYGEHRWQVRRERKGKYRSYLRNVALAYLEVNNKWLWKLAPGTLRNDVHVGIDVYHDLAVFTLIYGNGDLITFATVTSKRGEKLSQSLVYETIVKHMTSDLEFIPERLVFHRDGRFFRTEAKGILKALEALKERGLIASDFKYGMLEIHKTSAARPRLYKRVNGKFANPEIGVFVKLTENEGVLTTTGAPVISRGTAQPLTVERFMGNIPIEDMAHDAYALTHFAFSSPGAAMSLPFSISLADRILKERLPGVSTNLWDDGDETEEAEAFVIAREAGTGGNP